MKFIKEYFWVLLATAFAGLHWYQFGFGSWQVGMDTILMVVFMIEVNYKRELAVLEERINNLEN